MGNRILIVEDEVLLCMELSDMLTAAGFEVIGPAHTLGAGLDIARTEPLDAAILDVNLGKETSERIGCCLNDRHIPFVIVSAMRPIDLPGVLRAAPRCAKPVCFSHLLCNLHKFAVPHA